MDIANFSENFHQMFTISNINLLGILIRFVLGIGIMKYSG